MQCCKKTPHKDADYNVNKHTHTETLKTLLVQFSILCAVMINSRASLLMWPFVFLPLGPEQFKDLHIWCEPSDVSWVACLNVLERVLSRTFRCTVRRRDLWTGSFGLVRSPRSPRSTLTHFHWAINVLGIGLWNIRKDNFEKTHIRIQIMNAAFRCEWVWYRCHAL